MKRADAEILTVDDLAELFGCDKETAAARLTSGDLPGVKVGRGWIIPRQALFERLNEKALAEATARRAMQPTPPGNCEVTRTEVVRTAAAPPSPLLQITPSRQRGRRRREPPELPELT